MSNTRHRVGQCIMYLLDRYKKNWVYVSQQKFCDLLESYYQVKITTRTLRYHLKWLETNGYIKRYQNRAQREDGTWFMKVTAVANTLKGYQFWARQKWQYAREKAREFLKKYMPAPPAPQKDDAPGLDEDQRRIFEHKTGQKWVPRKYEYI